MTRAGLDKIDGFGKRLGASKQLRAAFALDPWGVAAQHAVPLPYLAALRQYEEKLRSTSVTKLNLAIERREVPPLGAAGRVPLRTRTLASDRGWDLRFEKVEKRILGVRVLLGVKLVLNDKLAKDICNGIAAGRALIGVIQAAATAAALSGPVGVAIMAGVGLFAAALQLEAALINLMNKGKGVSFFTSYWILLAILGWGPGGLIAAWVGPLSN